MNTTKFEYWAKRQGMSCVKTKNNNGCFSTYTTEETERAFLYWLDAFSPAVQSAFEQQEALKLKYKDVKIENEFIIKAINEKLEEFFSLTQNLDWLYAFSRPSETDNAHVLETFESAKRIYKRNILKLPSLLALQDLFIWRTSQDYPRIRAKVAKALNDCVVVIYSSGGLESAINEKLSGVILERRGDYKNNASDYKLSEGIVQRSIELSKEGTQ